MNMRANHMPPRRPVVLIILDGFGVNPSRKNNAVQMALTPHLDHYFSHYPHTTLQASGSAVGVADGQMGNSEIGHMTLGCGSILRQDTVRIDDAIISGDFFTNPQLLAAIARARTLHRPLHLLGLVSDGGVHSSLTHLSALIRLAKQHGVRPLLHMISDGRDTAPRSALEYLHRIEPLLHEAGGAIATLCGRYYAMDRDKRWERTERAWRAIVRGEGERISSAETGIRSAYAAGDSDEFIRPCVLPSWQAPLAGEPMISFNFRKDRPQQIVAALGQEEFTGFDRGHAPLFDLVLMMPYDPGLKMPAAFVSERPPVTLAEIISQHGIHQFHCAETEKYPHVTYFFNGGRHDPHVGETQLLIPSPRVATYDQKPAMNAEKVTAAVLKTMQEHNYGFILVNYANGDMVGHTAKADAIIAAVETLDRQVGRIMEQAEDLGYSVIVTADHGNCEEMVDPITGAPHTQHTLYPVPFLLMDESGWQLSCQGGLANVAPTVLQLMGLQQPIQMQAHSLLLKPIALPQAQSGLRGAA